MLHKSVGDVKHFLFLPSKTFLMPPRSPKLQMQFARLGVWPRRSEYVEEVSKGGITISGLKDPSFVPSSFLFLVVTPQEPLVASLLPVAMPGAPSSFLLLVASTFIIRWSPFSEIEHTV